MILKPLFANMLQHRLLKSLGPIVLSAFSVFVSFQVIQPIATLLNPSFSLFSNKGIGKIGITVLVLCHIALLLLAAPKASMRSFINTNFSFIVSCSWIKAFFQAFVLFFTFHVIFLFIFLTNGNATINTNCFYALTIMVFLKILFGFIATFFLAWTEELIFRGTIFPILAEKLALLPSALLASFIFMVSHDLHNPINLITKHRSLGLGLFLLGLFLNLVFIATNKLYVGMGIHAGLVFVKVILRRIPILIFSTTSIIPWWLDKDLRQAPLIHLVLLIACLIVIFFNRKKIFFRHQ
jgi:membrane protease YdiL (CAAX protease family)